MKMQQATFVITVYEDVRAGGRATEEGRFQ